MNKRRQKFAVILIFIVLGLFYVFDLAPSAVENSDVEPEIVTIVEPTVKVTSSENGSSKVNPTHQNVGDQESLEKELTSSEIQQLRTKAKATLASIYAGQRSVFAEYNRYTSDLALAGVLPDTRKMVFKYGFLNEFIPDTFQDYQGSEEPRRKDSDAFLEFQFGDSGDKHYYDGPAQQINLTDFSQYCTNECKATQNAFELLLVLPLTKNRFDVWTINEQKMIKQVKDGTKLD